jgi:hypothetical protein
MNFLLAYPQGVFRCPTGQAGLQKRRASPIDHYFDYQPTIMLVMADVGVHSVKSVPRRTHESESKVN